MDELVFQNGHLHIGQAIFQRYISAHLIDHAVRQICHRIIAENLSRPLIIGVREGGIYFQKHLESFLQHFNQPFDSDTVKVSSYGVDEKSSGQVTYDKPPSMDLAGRDVIVVDDAMDTGLSFDYLYSDFKNQDPKSLRFIPFLKKKISQQIPVNIFCHGIEINDVFVIGYGLDFKKRTDTRKLPDIYFKIN